MCSKASGLLGIGAEGCSIRSPKSPSTAEFCTSMLSGFDRGVGLGTLEGGIRAKAFAGKPLARR